MSVYDDEKAGDNITLHLVRKLKAIMEIQEISMNQLSKDSGVSLATISRLLNEHTQPKFGTLFELYCALDIEFSVHGCSKETGIEVL